MISLLQSILEIFEDIPDYIAAGAVDTVNLGFRGLEAAVNTFLEGLPGMPAIVGPPDPVAAANWFFDLGAIVSVASSMLTSYLLFVVGRWLLRKAGLIG